ncbi:MAG: ATP-binding protein [bacterium]
MVELAVDLTEKIELERKLKEAKKHLQAIFDSIEDGISVIDRDYQIVRVNQGILRMYNKRDFPDLIGKKCFTEYYQSDGICENCPAQKTFEEDKPHHVTKIRHHRDKGRTVLDISTFPIKDDEGKVIQVINYIKDVTAAIKLEDRLLYQERLAGVGELAAGIAHEIRNPLGNITAAAQFCLDKYKLHQPARKHLRIILRNAENANKIVKDLLDFARPAEISFKLADVGEVIASACHLVKTRCSQQGVRLTRRYSRRLPLILLDEKRLEEAFLNFILNALDAMPNGGRLTITTYSDSQNNEVGVRFSDTGQGIPEENLNEIFTPFFTTKEEGIGLGLCLAHQIVTYHKGKINIESKVGQGTEVIVSLPISREE